MNNHSLNVPLRVFPKTFKMQSDFGGAEANIERIMLLANPVHTVNNANDEEALSRCKRANLKASI